MSEQTDHYADGFTAAYAGQPASELYRTADERAAYAEGYTDGETQRPLGRVSEATPCPTAGCYNRGTDGRPCVWWQRERVSEPTTAELADAQDWAARGVASAARYVEAVTGGKAERTERITTAELAVGDVIEHDSGHREVVARLGERKEIAGQPCRWVQVAVSEDGETSGSFWALRSRWDRLTDAAKREAGYPVADVDVPSEREPRGQVFWDGSCRYCNRYRRACGRNHVSEEREHVIGAHDVAALRRALAGDGDLHALITAILSG